MAESFADKRKRELGITGKKDGEMSFAERRKIELGMTPAKKVDAPTNLVLTDTLKSVMKPVAGEKKTVDFKAAQTAAKKETVKPVVKETQGFDFKAAQSQDKPKTLQGALPAAQLLTGSFPSTVQSTLKNKVPAASALIDTGDGPSNASQIPGISQYEINKKEIDKAPPVIKQYAQVMNYLTEGNPIGVAVGNSFSGNSGVTRKDSSGNAVVDKISGAINKFVTPVLTPTGAPLGQGTIGASYDATGKLLSGAAGNKLTNLVASSLPFSKGGAAAQNIARVGLTEGIAGAMQGVGLGMQEGQTTGKEILKNAGYGAVGGSLLGGFGTAAGEGLTAALSKVLKRTNRADDEVAATLEEIFTPKTEVVAPNEMKTNLPEVNPTLSLPQSPERLALPQGRNTATSARISKQTNVYKQKFEALIAEAQKRPFSPGREDIELESLWSQMADRNDPGLDELIDLAYPKKTAPTPQKGMVQAARTNQEMREVAGVGNPVKSTAPQVFADAAAPRKVLAKAGTAGTKADDVIRQPVLSREQEIINKGNNITQEDIDFAMSDQWDNSKLLPESVPTESTYVKPTPKPVDPTPIKTEIKPKIKAKSSVESEVAATSELQPANKTAIVTEVKTSAVKKKATPGIRANFKTMTDSNAISATLKGKIAQLDQKYSVLKNADVVAKSDAALKDISKVESEFLASGSTGAQHISNGYRAMQELDKAGEHARALAIADKLAKDLTEAGQTVQAASLISRLSPEGQLLNLIRTAERNGKVVELADKVKFTELATKVQENTGAGKIENSVNDILDRISKGEKLSAEDVGKLSDLLSKAQEKIKPKAPKAVVDKLPKELDDVRTRDKVVSFLEAQEAAAQARINKRRGRLNSTPVAEWIDYSILIAAKVSKKIIKAETHIEDIVKLFGEDLRPVATQIFQKAQEMVGSVTKGAAEGNLVKAQKSFEKISKQSQEKEIVEETAMHVRQLLEDAKAGNLTADGIQKLRDYSDEIAEMLSEKPAPLVQSQEQKFLQTVKSLSNKIAQVENESIPADQANREVSNLLRQITKLSEDGTKIKPEPIDSQAISDIAHDVLSKTRPDPKPTTLHEKIVAKYLKENPQVTPQDIESLRTLSKSLTELQGTDKIKADMAMQKILNSYEKSSVMDKINALRYIAMLYNSGTQLINALSGPLMATTGRTADVFGSMIDIALSTAMKQPRTTTLYGGNPVKFLAEYIRGLGVGAKAGWEGVNPAGIQGANEIRGLTYKSLYNPLSLLERSLGAVAKGADYAAYTAIHGGEMEKQGFLDALENGIKRSNKEAIKRHIRKFVNDPTEAALEQADRIAKNATFQRNDTLGGETANWLNSGTGKVQKVVNPVVRTVFPFVRTPINIASTAFTMSPGGIIKGLIQLSGKSNVGQREAIRTLSLGLTGTGLSAVGYYLNQVGIITGANDSGDTSVNSIREQAGKGKYRFNTSALQRYMGALLNGEGADAAEKAAKYQKGDKAFDYNKLQPIAFPAAIGAQFSELKGNPIENRLAGTVSGAAGSLFGMSTLRGVQDVFQPQYGGTQGEKATGVATRLGESFFKSFSPSMLAQEARRQDPIVRKTPYNDGLVTDVKGYFQSRTPGLSKNLPASKDTLGQSKKNAPGIMGQYVNPYKSEAANYTQAAQFISDLMDRTGDDSLAPKPPAKKVSGKNENDEKVSYDIPVKRYEKLQEDIGKEIINRVMNMEAGTDMEQSAELTDIYEEVRKQYMDEVKEELGIVVN